MTEHREPEEITVRMGGGELAVLRWPAAADDAPLALLVHGITANAQAWGHVAPALRGFEVLAPDLRGRAGSAGLPGPYGIEAHADDVEALLRTFAGDGRRVVLVGHSMGAFVATMATAGVARDRVHGLVLVDGGAQLPMPAGADIDAMLAATLGPSLARFELTFPDLAAVRAFWAEHPAVGPWVDDPVVAAYLARDVVPADGGLRTACVPEAIRTDGGDVLVNERVLEATSNLPIPATLLWATRGLQNQTPGLYDPVRLDRLGLDRVGITAREVPDTNHYSIVWDRRGVEAIAGAVRASTG